MKNKNIITIGGGTGSFVLLSGLKKYPINISAIVSMADDGGSTGVLRDELGVLPPGDIRQCLVALSDSSEILRNLFNYRFESGGLRGHNFGNLFLSALEKTSGGFQKAVEEAGKILNIKGEVIPITESDVKLIMKLKNKKVLNGENEIFLNYEIEKIGIEKYFLTPAPKPNKKALAAIKKADAIIIGPGNLHCSLLPNLLVKEISATIKKSKAQIILVCNLFNKKGKTEKFGLDDYVRTIESYIGKNKIDYVIYNTQRPPNELMKKYLNKLEKPIHFGENKNRGKYKVVQARILSDKIFRHSKFDPLLSDRSFIRHDSAKLAKVIMFVLDVKDNKNIISKII